MDFDFIIIGSGLAGLTAAIRASRKHKVLVITKEHLQDANTFYAQGGIAAVWEKTDSFASHIKDTVTAGAGHNDRKAVTFIVKKAPAAIRRLITLGIRFNHKTDDGLSLNLEGGHSRNRIVNAGDRTGMVVENTLISRISANRNITVMENALVADLLVRNGICHGVRILKGKRFLNLFARRIIIASGGLANIYESTTNPDTATGDGIAMAHRAGCKLKDLEFIQFHPTALDVKARNKSKSDEPLFLLSETLRGHGARLVNAKGEYFMKRLHKLADLAPRDVISRAIFVQRKKGPVYLDCRMIAPRIFRKDFPQITARLKSEGIDPSKDLIPVTPAAHYTCGGIKTDLNGKTNIKNLYACGETACTGMHGANRLASNSLLEAAVMGRQTAITPLPKKDRSKPPIFDLPSYKIQPSTSTLRHKIRAVMWNEVGIVREEKSLRKAMKTLTDIQKEMPPPTDGESVITNNILTCAILVTRAALARKRSLGCHFIPMR
jgi:L-aspartate oxidase